jgi:hypothetical protein
MMKIIIALGLASFAWVSVVTLSWILRVIINEQLLVPVIVLLFGVGLMVVARTARKSGWGKTKHNVPSETVQLHK